MRIMAQQTMASWWQDNESDHVIGSFDDLRGRTEG
jgi:hypothetical protein